MDSSEEVGRVEDAVGAEVVRVEEMLPFQFEFVSLLHPVGQSF